MENRREGDFPLRRFSIFLFNETAFWNLYYVVKGRMELSVYFLCSSNGSKIGAYQRRSLREPYKNVRSTIAIVNGLRYNNGNGTPAFQLEIEGLAV